MRYVIAGGGAFGSHYLRKISDGVERGTLSPSQVIVVDRDRKCEAASMAPAGFDFRLEICDWREFGRKLWDDRSPWLADIWVPAPIAPHLLAEWLIDRAWDRERIKLVPCEMSSSLPELPYAKKLPDHRILLSHAPGLCPVDCIEPATCAITKGRRWWEMADTISGWLSEQRLDASATANFFCKHHCASGQYGVGGIPFSVIFDETDKALEALVRGAATAAVATFSSCHGVITPFRAIH